MLEGEKFGDAGADLGVQGVEGVGLHEAVLVHLDNPGPIAIPLVEPSQKNFIFDSIPFNHSR